jgi:hypothetical protein
VFPNTSRQFGLLAWLTLIATVTVHSQSFRAPEQAEQQEDVLARSARISDSAVSAVLAFQDAVAAAGVPGGVAYSEGCSDQPPPPTVHPRGTTLREVLDSISGGDSGYIWKLNDGVVNFEPARGLPTLLKTHLNGYDSGDVVDAVSAVTFLVSSPEVNNAAAKLGLERSALVSGLGGFSLGPQPPKKPLGIRLKNTTLLDALNAIARSQKRGVWRYSEIHCDSGNQYVVDFSG